ncbi:hypothetical protein IDJ77_26665 [Mucilaginibacter sp. ZT4R22]|uniref:Uncharacterized protein n=1 Tax=Mucilaginibacter pankratovii TaxID=2772110 RepID=A0ABR7WYQ6_9SPHI|nr:hypothetical protein [Mucilaginibacter pankratovii]MBD1367422.1 hypothetical protein [Mucilaginibacter pankratovii]
MSRPDKAINILLYEDKPDYSASFRTTAQKQRILTKATDNADELLELLKSSPRKYVFIVLDARAFMHEGQAVGTEDEMNLIKIIQDLEEFKRQNHLTLPYCINTGFADLKLRLSNKVSCPIFEKGNEAELIDHIWIEYMRTDDAKLLMEHPEIFGFATDHFDDAAYAVLANLFTGKKYLSLNIAQRVNNLAALRRTAEHLMDIINNDYLGNVVPPSGSRLNDITAYLNLNQDIPVHVFSTVTSIRKIAGYFGSHTPSTSQEIAAYPSGELIGGLASSLKDVFIWAHTLCSHH